MVEPSAVTLPETIEAGAQDAIESGDDPTEDLTRGVSPPHSRSIHRSPSAASLGNRKSAISEGGRVRLLPSDEYLAPQGHRIIDTHSASLHFLVLIWSTPRNHIRTPGKTFATLSSAVSEHQNELLGISQRPQRPPRSHFKNRTKQGSQHLEDSN